MNALHAAEAGRTAVQTTEESDHDGEPQLLIPRRSAGNRGGGRLL